MSKRVVCGQCGQEIIRKEGRWEHAGDRPRHPAWPKGKSIAGKFGKDLPESPKVERVERAIVVRKTKIERESTTQRYHVPGRRPTGIIVQAAPNLAAALKPEDAMTGIPRNLTIGQAIQFAQLFTKKRVTTLELSGRCHLSVNFPPVMTFKGRSWYSALCALNTFMKKGAVWEEPVMDI